MPFRHEQARIGLAGQFAGQQVFGGEQSGLRGNRLDGRVPAGIGLRFDPMARMETDEFAALVIRAHENLEYVLVENIGNAAAAALEGRILPVAFQVAAQVEEPEQQLEDRFEVCIGLR